MTKCFLYCGEAGENKCCKDCEKRSYCGVACLADKCKKKYEHRKLKEKVKENEG